MNTHNPPKGWEVKSKSTTMFKPNKPYHRFLNRKKRAQIQLHHSEGLTDKTLETLQKGLFG